MPAITEPVTFVMLGELVHRQRQLLISTQCLAMIPPQMQAQDVLEELCQLEQDLGTFTEVIQDRECMRFNAAWEALHPEAPNQPPPRPVAVVVNFPTEHYEDGICIDCSETFRRCRGTGSRSVRCGLCQSARTRERARERCLIPNRERRARAAGDYPHVPSPHQPRPDSTARLTVPLERDGSPPAPPMTFPTRNYRDVVCTDCGDTYRRSVSGVKTTRCGRCYLAHTRAAGKARYDTLTAQARAGAAR